MSENESTNENENDIDNGLSWGKIFVGCIIVGLIVWAIVEATRTSKDSNASSTTSTSPTPSTSPPSTSNKLPAFKKPPPPVSASNFAPIPTCFSAPTQSMFFSPLHDAFLLLYPTLHIYEVKDQAVVLRTPGFTMERLLVSFVIIPQQDWQATEDARKRMTAAQLLDRYNAYKYLPGNLRRGEAIILVKNENDCQEMVSIAGALFLNNESQSFGPVCWYSVDMNHNIMKNLKSQMIELFDNEYAPYKFARFIGVYPKNSNEVVMDIEFDIENRREIGRFTFRQGGNCQNITLDVEGTKNQSTSSTSSTTPDQPVVLSNSGSIDTEVKIINNLFADTSTVVRSPRDSGGLDPLCPIANCAYCVDKDSFAVLNSPSNYQGMFDTYVGSKWSSSPFSAIPVTNLGNQEFRPVTTCPPGTEPVNFKPGQCIECEYPVGDSRRDSVRHMCGSFKNSNAEVINRCTESGGTFKGNIVGPRWSPNWIKNIL